MKTNKQRDAIKKVVKENVHFVNGQVHIGLLYTEIEGLIDKAVEEEKIRTGRTKKRMFENGRKKGRKEARVEVFREIEKVWHKYVCNCNYGCDDCGYLFDELKRNTLLTKPRMKKVTPPDEFCRCGGIKLPESEFCKDCI